MLNKEIAIIGGGLTGLTAAYYLVQKGYAITILEKESYLGGLASTTKLSDTDIEKTYHHIFPSDTYIIQLVKELGIEDNLKWFNSSIGLYYGRKVSPFSGALDLLRFEELSYIDRLRTGFTIFLLTKFKFASTYHRTSAYDWLLKFSGKNAMKVIWEPLLKGKFHSHYKDIALPWLWARMYTRASNRNILDNTEKLGVFHGGFKVIVDALVDRLRTYNVEIRTNSAIQHIYQDDNRLNLIFNNETRSFDKIIATISSNIFSKIIDKKDIGDHYFNRIHSVSYLGAVNCVFSSSQDLGEYYWTNINDLNFPFLVFINHTKLTPKEWYNGQNIYYLGTYIPNDHKYFKMDDDEIIDNWFFYLKKIFPMFDENKVIQKKLSKFKNAQHIVTKNYFNNMPDIKTPIPNLYLSNFSQIYPEDRGTNFAIRQGIHIANML